MLYMTYSLNQSLRRAADTSAAVASRVGEHDIRPGEGRTLREGNFADYTRDLVLSRDKRYLVVCEMGRHLDREGNLMASKVLVRDLHASRDSVLQEISNQAHAQFDPDDTQTLYLSNHNFRFEHTRLGKLARTRTYSIKFLGPASVHKFRIGPDGPYVARALTHPELYRLTNFHMFWHRGQKLLIAFGAWRAQFPLCRGRGDPANPAPDRSVPRRQTGRHRHVLPVPGCEKALCSGHSTFHTVDIAAGVSEYVRESLVLHTCSNHILVTANTQW
jgi:hypothetical protein